MDRRSFIRIAGGSIATLAVAGCGGNGGGSETTTGGGGGGETTTDVNDTVNETTTAGEATTGGSGNADLDATVGVSPGNIEVSNVELVRTDGGARVTGTITNTGDATIEQLEVQATLLDQSDDILGQYFDNTEGENAAPLEPGETWQFSIDFPSADLGSAVAYRIDVDSSVDNNVDVSIGNESDTDTSTPG